LNEMTLKERLSGSFVLVSVLARQSFLNTLAFRANYWIGMLSELALLLLALQLWQAIYNGRAEVNGYSLTAILTYMVLTRLMPLIDMAFVGRVQQRILTGGIVGDLLKPMRLSVYLFAQELGEFASRLLFLVLPILTIAALFVGLEPPASALSLGLFAVSIGFAFIILFQMNFMTSLLAFWVTQLFSLNVVKGQTIRLLSGSLVPLWFFPAGLAKVLPFLPFACVAFVPIQFYFGDYRWPDAARMFLFQLIWISLLGWLSAWLFRRAVRYISVNGG
jgi:ABC-2 type transport system permease protein